MAAPKIQFPTTDERLSWFKSQAEERGMTQDAVFEDMQQVYIKVKLAEDHPDQAASIATYEALSAQMHDLVAGLVVNADTAKDVARRQMAEDIAKAEKARDAALAQVDDLKRQAEDVKASEDMAYSQLTKCKEDLAHANRRVSELEEQLSDLRSQMDELRTSLERERRVNGDANAIIEQMHEELKAAESAPAKLAAAHAEVQRLTTELAAKTDIIARADSEIARLTAQVEKLQNKLLGE